MGPESVETQTPPFWQGLWRSHESTVLARTPCEKRKYKRTHYHTEGVEHSYPFPFSVAAPQKIKEAVSRNNNGQKIHSDMAERTGEQVSFSSRHVPSLLKSFNARGFFCLAFHLLLPPPISFGHCIQQPKGGGRKRHLFSLALPRD